MSPKKLQSVLMTCLRMDRTLKKRTLTFTLLYVCFNYAILPGVKDLRGHRSPGACGGVKVLRDQSPQERQGLAGGQAPNLGLGGVLELDRGGEGPLVNKKTGKLLRPQDRFYFSFWTSRIRGRGAERTHPWWRRRRRRPGPKHTRA